MMILFKDLKKAGVVQMFKGMSMPPARKDGRKQSVAGAAPAGPPFRRIWQGAQGHAKALGCLRTGGVPCAQRTLTAKTPQAWPARMSESLSPKSRHWEGSRLKSKTAFSSRPGFGFRHPQGPVMPGWCGQW